MKIDSKTKLFAVIGNPIEHSKSPLIHNIALEEAGINGVYMAFKVENVERAVETMKEFDIRGYSVTIPHKLEIMKYLDEIDPLAKKMGAVNTVHNSNGKLFGYNTDCLGAMNALKAKTSLEGKKVALLGAGGAARAIVNGLEKEKAKVTIYNRTIENAKKLAEEFNCSFEELKNYSGDFDVLINATSLGMFPNIYEIPIEKEKIKEGQIVFDIVYNPLETKLIREAKAKNCEIILGIEMLLEQAYEQFRIWNNKEPTKEKMRNALIKKLEEERK
jgi:shikimate dehydrogenase